MGYDEVGQICRLLNESRSTLCGMRNGVFKNSVRLELRKKNLIEKYLSFDVDLFVVFFSSRKRLHVVLPKGLTVDNMSPEEVVEFCNLSLFDLGRALCDPVFREKLRKSDECEDGEECVVHLLEHFLEDEPEVLGTITFSNMTAEDYAKVQDLVPNVTYSWKDTSSREIEVESRGGEMKVVKQRCVNLDEDKTSFVNVFSEIVDETGSVSNVRVDGQGGKLEEKKSEDEKVFVGCDEVIDLTEDVDDDLKAECMEVGMDLAENFDHLWESIGTQCEKAFVKASSLLPMSTSGKNVSKRTSGAKKRFER